MRTMVIAVPAAALLLVAAGCGGSSSSSEGDSTATIESSDTTAADTTGGTDTSGTETSGTDTSGSDDASLEGCTKLADLSSSSPRRWGRHAGGGGQPDLDATAKAYEEFADEVPEEIRDAFRTIAAAFCTYAEALRDVDLSSGETPDAETLQKFADAAKELDNTEAHCRERRDRGVGEGELHHRRVAR